MKIACGNSERGIALIIVMVSIFVLAVLAGGFAYSMKVETKLAGNASYEGELEWLGRSGVELARYVLGQQLLVGCEPYDALNQVWAGGGGSGCMSNSPLDGIQLKGVALGNGTISVSIVDLERKVNINTAGEPLLQQALVLMGMDASELPTVVSSIQDWIDADKSTHISGTESTFYQGFNPPYVAKDGPIDDMAELLLVNGVTPEIYWGPAHPGYSLAAFQAKEKHFSFQEQLPVYSAGLVDLFTPIAAGKININTASPEVLQLIPGIDSNLAQAIVAARSEGVVPGDPFVGPFVNLDPNYLWKKVPGLTLEGGRMLQQYCEVRSRTFQVTVDADAGNYHRQFVAVLARNGPRDVQVLTFYAK